MRRTLGRRAGLAAAAAAAALVLPGTATAGCPVGGNPGGNPGVSDWQELTIADAVDRSLAQITPAFYAYYGIDPVAFRQARIDRYTREDRSGDGLVCQTVLWGTELSPNSHWYDAYVGLADPSQTQLFVFTDNRAQAA